MSAKFPRGGAGPFLARSLLVDLVGFGYDLSDPKMDLSVLNLTSSPPDKDSGERSSAHGPSWLT